MEEILTDAVERQNAMYEQGVQETQRINDRLYSILGDPDATIFDLREDEPKPESGVEDGKQPDIPSTT